MKHLKHIADFINEDRRPPSGSNWINTGKKSIRMHPGWYRHIDKEDENSLMKDDNMRIDDTNKYKILKFIYKSGLEGRRYTDIVKYIVEELWNQGKYDWKVHRGMYATGLLGTWNSDGILPLYCKKNENNKWILTNEKLVDHFNDLKEKGTIDKEWWYRDHLEKGFDKDTVDLMGLMGTNNKNTEDW